LDVTTAIVDIIQAVAWPSAILGGVWLLRREIRALLKRVSGIRYKDLEIAIGEELIMAGAALQPSLPEQSGGSPPPAEDLRRPQETLRLPPSQKEESPIARLMALVERSPREVIIQAWTLLQNQLIEVAKRKGHDFLSAPISVPYALNAAVFLLTEKLIPDSFAAAVQYLGAVYSKVSDNPDFRPTPRKAREFVLYADSIWEKLKMIQ
jgi:hypothetical protein